MKEKNNTFYIETYGCTSNQADSKIISQILMDAGYKKADIENANFIIINTCGVKQQTENKIKRRLRELHELYKNNKHKHVIIAGCLPHIAPDYLELVRKIIPSHAAILGLNTFQEIPSLFEQIKQGNRNIFVKSNKKIDKARFLIKHSHDTVTGIIPISEGCLGNCTYCCVKNARGHLKCYDPGKIVENVKSQLNQGIKEILLTSQDCSVYKYRNTDLKDLIIRISRLDHEFFLRIGMINPAFLINNFEQLLTIFKSDKVYQFLHLPIQAGSDKILKKMKRPYTITTLLDKIDLLRKEFPFLTFSTDIICGFPGETEHDFYKTINVIKWLRPEIINISKFTPRPNTEAKNMEQVDSKIIKERSKRLSAVFRIYLEHLNDKWKGWKGKMLCLYHDEKNHYTFGRNFAYKNILLPNIKIHPGTFIKVSIQEVDGANLIGTPY